MARLTRGQIRRELAKLTEENEHLLYGECVVFAIALHKITKLPLFGIVGFDWDIEKHALVHAYVKLDQIIIDIRGPRTYADVLEDFEGDPATDLEEVPFTVGRLARLGTGSSRCPPLHAVLPKAERVWTLTQQLLNIDG